MSSTYPDLPLTNMPDALDTLLNVMDVDIDALPYAAQYYNAIQAGDLAAAQDVLASYPRLKSMGITKDHINAMDQRIIAMERWVTANQRQILFSAAEPSFQAAGDIWAKILNGADTVNIQFYQLTAEGYKLITLSADSVLFSDGKTAQARLGGIRGITASTSETEPGLALDATVGAKLSESLNEVNSALTLRGIAVESWDQASGILKLVSWPGKGV